MYITKNNACKPKKECTVYSFIKGEQSVAAVELALILPILLIILFAIVELSTLLYDKAVITNASREAARAGIVNSSVTDAVIQGYAQNYCKDRLITYRNPNTPNVIVSRPLGSDPGNPLIVTVNYQFNGLVLGVMLRPQNWDQTLSSTSVMNFE